MDFLSQSQTLEHSKLKQKTGKTHRRIRTEYNLHNVWQQNNNNTDEFDQLKNYSDSIQQSSYTSNNFTNNNNNNNS